MLTRLARTRRTRQIAPVPELGQVEVPRQARLSRDHGRSEGGCRRSRGPERWVAGLRARQYRDDRLRGELRRCTPDRRRLPAVRAEEAQAEHRRRHAGAEERSPALDGHAPGGRDEQGVWLPEGLVEEPLTERSTGCPAALAGASLRPQSRQ